MKIKEVYECEYCGKTFENSAECIEHELKCEFKKVINQIHAFDCKFRPVDIMNKNINDIYYIKADTFEALQFLIKKFEAEDACPFNSADDIGVTFYWDMQTDGWENLEENLKKLYYIRDTFFEAMQKTGSF